jgi:capsular polysaccharide biosynthesis protein
LKTKPQSYQASMRFAVGVSPEPRTGDYYTYDRYYTWLASEYLVDDLAEVLKSAGFAAAVSEELSGQGIRLPAGAIQGSTQAGKLHRILSVSIGWGKENELRQIANGVVSVLGKRSAEFLAQLGSENAAVALIDPPVVSPVGASLKERLDLPIRLFLALLIGVALAFALDYLDESVRNSQEVEAAGMPLLGQVPPYPRKSWLPWRNRWL